MVEKIGLLLNLGTPDSPSVQDVRRYLNQFLMDPDVIDLPWIVRKILVSFCIVPLRSAKSAHAYQSVWTKKGSPLLVNSLALQQAVNEKTVQPIFMAMRYGSPSIEQQLLTIKKKYPAAEEIVILPLYPHYAGSTVKSCIKEINRVVKKLNIHCRLNIIPPFYQHSDYIDALVATTRETLEQPYDHILFSYHGIPERHILKEDPTKKHCLQQDCCKTASPAHATCYRYQVTKTTEYFAKKAKIPAGQYSMSFQSRLGKAKWLEPYTDKVLVELAEKGIKRLLVICPSFTADCLETVEEIGIRGRILFERAGGEKLTLVPCLNSHEAWVNAILHWFSLTGLR
ncbi:MAG: ferrochelatase [Endozoicomonadaceae bacterium]|nr:ferrochelatase [Endozoicomonadaceae bacterium]